MIPLKDLNPRRSFHAVTLLLIFANVVVFLYQVALPHAAGEVFVKTYALTPSYIKLALEGHRHPTALQAFLPLFTSKFFHGGWLHIIGNMWFLWIFGDNVEDQFGHLGYLMFYIICGLGSGVSQVIFSWGSAVPSLGASGAISGVLGAYIVFFPRAKVLTLVPLLIFFFTINVPAYFFIGLWFLMNFLSGVVSLGSIQAANAGGVAWWAHVGGFLIGVLIAMFTKLIGHRPAYA